MFIHFWWEILGVTHDWRYILIFAGCQHNLLVNSAVNAKKEGAKGGMTLRCVAVLSGDAKVHGAPTWSSLFE